MICASDRYRVGGTAGAAVEEDRPGLLPVRLLRPDLRRQGQGGQEVMSQRIGRVLHNKQGRSNGTGLSRASENGEIQLRLI